MAHKVRVNKGQRVIRFHYANCKSYNADFDGDEINVHFPQDQLGRAEAATIVQNDLQYIVPTDGSPIRGLIQDHVIAGVQICQINRCFTKEEYSELAFLMLTGLSTDLGLPDNQILTVPPAYMKPVRRWTGKQLITTILINLLHDCPPLNTESGCKVKGVMVGQHKHEERVVIRGNDFLTGCLDKNQVGASAEGIVHAVFESYGANKAGLLLTIFGRLFTHFMQVLTYCLLRASLSTHTDECASNGCSKEYQASASFFWAAARRRLFFGLLRHAVALMQLLHRAVDSL
jgi:DNA-directed RNA polymerase I subunit RPA1